MVEFRMDLSYVGNNTRENPNSDTTTLVILVVQAMHCLSCVCSYTVPLGKLYVRPYLTDNVFKKIIAINIWLLNNDTDNTFVGNGAVRQNFPLNTFRPASSRPRINFALDSSSGVVGYKRTDISTLGL